MFRIHNCKHFLVLHKLVRPEQVQIHSLQNEYPRVPGDSTSLILRGENRLICNQGEVCPQKTQRHAFLGLLMLFEYIDLFVYEGRWGGLWRAPRHYTFVATNNKQTNVDLVKKFDNWKYDDYGIEKRMPWISGAKLTTSWNATGDRQWGTLIGNYIACQAKRT